MTASAPARTGDATSAPGRRSRLLAAAVLAATATAAVVGMAARSDAEKPGGDIPVTEISVTAEGISGPTALPPGVTTFHTSSSLPGTDSLAIVRLDDGVTYDQIFGYLASGDLPAVLQHVSGKGGIAHGSAHNGSRWTTNLTSGDYLYVDDEAGLVAPFHVSGERQHAKAPQADGNVTFAGAQFSLPRQFGSGTWRFVNDDSIHHELGILHIAPGHTQADVEHALTAGGPAPSWIEPQGTVNPIGPGESAWVTFSDVSGFYMVADYLPMLQGAAPGPVVQFRTFA